MVALGSIFSSVWIVVANSWQQTPTGFELRPWTVNGETMLRAEITDFWAMVFNPSTVHRLTHVLIGCFIMGAFFIMSISAWYILRNQHLEFAKRSFNGALLFGTVFSLAALVSGHLQANNVYETQPAKLAAFEGQYKTGPGDLSLVGIPNTEKQRLDYNLAIPGGLSFLIHEDFNEPVVGLDKFAKQDRPPVLIPFATYHLMVGLGTFFIVLTLVASFFRWRGTLFQKRWLMWVFVFAVLGAVAANQAGWVAAETGRQPWIVHPPIWQKWNPDGTLQTGADGVVNWPTTTVTMPDGTKKTTITGLRTTEGVSEAIHANQVLGSIIMFGLIYLLLGFVWLFVLNNKIQHGPPPLREGTHGQPEDSTEGYFDSVAERKDHHRLMMDPKQERDETR
jgi:cytochrome d ubiquinol oxidase subunit I